MKKTEKKINESKNLILNEIINDREDRGIIN